MGLRDTYAYAIQTAKGKFQGNAEEREGKLHFKGTVATEDDKNAIWCRAASVHFLRTRYPGDRRTPRGRPGASASRSRRGQDLHRETW